MRFRPCIDLHGGKVKQIIGGTLSDQSGTARENFVSEHDAPWYAALYRENSLTGGHVIMLGPGNDQQARKALGVWPGGLQIGGGITADNAAQWLDAGASHVIVTSYVFHDGTIDTERLKKLTDRVGRDRLVLDLSCRRTDRGYRIATDRWQTLSRETVTPALLERLGRECAEFLVHAVDVEGRQSGIEPEVVSLLAEYAPVPSTYAGGITTLQDIDLIAELGQQRVDYTVGSALDLFGGSLPFRLLVQKEP